VAVLSVVLFHAFPGSVFKSGFAGVDVFFVISGFLISSILFKGMDAKISGGERPFTFLGFYSRRVRRIFPSLILCLLFFLGLGWFVLLPDEYSLLGKHAAGASAYVSNFVLWSESGDYFQTASQMKPLLHLWSLGIEEQFYLLWPLFLYLALRLNLSALPLALIAALASFGFGIHAVKADPSAAFWSPLLRFWELAAGGILAWLVLYRAQAFRAFAQKTGPVLGKILLRNPERCDGVRVWQGLLSALGAALILIGVLALNSQHFPGSKALYPVLGAVLLIAAGPQAPVNRLLSCRLAVWIGLISYPLYIWHWPFLSFAWIIEGSMPPAWVRVACVAAAVLMSAFTFYIVEPHLRWGRHGGAKALGLLIAMLITGFAGWEIYHHGGYKNRMPASEATQAITDKITPIRSQAFANCNAVFPEWNEGKYSFCAIEKPDGNNTVALIGDSHAGALYDGILAHEKHNEGAALFSFPCALPLMGAQSGYGEQWRRNAEGNRYNYKFIEKGFSYVLSRPELKTVILTGFPGCFDHGGLSDLSDPKLTDKRQILEKAAAKTFKALTDAGKQVLFIFDVPTLATDFRYWDLKKLNECKNALGSQDASLGLRGKLMGRGQNDNAENACTILQKESGTLDAHNLIKEVITAEASKHPGVKTMDLSDLLCNQEGKCVLQKDGNVLYADAHHLNLNGSLFAASAILKILRGK